VQGAAGNRLLDQQLPGVWNLQVALPGLTFNSMITFSPQGTLVEIAAPRSEASLGVWRSTSETAFHYVMRSYVHTNPPGQPSVTLHSVDATGSMTAQDAFEGTAILTISDPADQTVIMTAEPTFSASRMLI
jgi:hypothetical protein